MSKRSYAVGLCLLSLVAVFSLLVADVDWPSISKVDAQETQPAKAKNKSKFNAKNKGKAGAKGRAAQPPAPPPPTASEGGVPVLSSGDSYDDFASVVQAKDGGYYAAYAAYYDGHDQVRMHKLEPDGRWSTRVYVPLVEARPDIWMPQLAVDAMDRVWVIWSEQTDRTRTESGNWDLYARMRDHDTTWGPIVRLTTDPKPDINHHVTTDKQGNIYVAWQAHPENNGDVMLVHYDGDEWSKPLAVTSGPASDWYPQVAVDDRGTAWIAFDSYRNGDYDVFLTSVSGDRVGETIPIATSKYYEAHASVACAEDGAVWVAWEQGGWNWGKDQGYWLRITNLQAGTTLGSTRQVKVAAYRDGRVLAAPTVAIPQALAAAAEQPGSHDLSASTTGDTAGAGLSITADGRLWLRFRKSNRGAQRRPGSFARYWTENVTYLTDKGWAPAQAMAGSTGRISVFSRQFPTSDNGLAVAYSSDQRSAVNFHMPQHDQALVNIVAKPTERPSMPPLAEYKPPEPPTDLPNWDTEREARQVATAREHRATLDGTPLQIVRGDLHRHTELSWDVGPGNDGSYLDFYRYMIDVAEMDFGGLTDHQGGGHYAYHWWLTEKSCDLYYLAPRFVPLYGYERSASFPNGHRNIFHTYRGVPIFPFQIKLTATGVFPGVGGSNLIDNDTKLLYQFLRGTQGIAISHTSGTDSMGTDWRDNDPEIEPVVEIYQGARNSYEVVGGPRVHDVSQMAPNQAPGGYQTAGMVWEALAKGYRLGTTASSDHGSTHLSYSLVYTPANDRVSILDAIRQRHTYGSTDNIVVECWANKRFMGEEFDSSDKPSLSLLIKGTADVARVSLIRNNEYIYTTSPFKAEAEVTFNDMQPKKGLNYYYFRVEQADGEIAWASPVWINYTGN